MPYKSEEILVSLGGAIASIYRHSGFSNPIARRGFRFGRRYCDCAYYQASHSTLH